ncbi:MAG: hypothetical protein F4117_07385 [Acidimicrobiales bacterium]|nr:hypothetical protein [Acidimicrobiales bacterium]MXX42599.1 hypothetical protein [Acidimicrobiales bacterium]MXY03807.1 hypothetical protein [Acidimicrobiales bacterium]MXZ15906.1 hypothetical protein [Acidimicrobiales bacterium]MYA81638.1 hypothetical protein [Acidimicrobiales bacterium]
MTHPRYRAVIVLLAGLAGLGVLAGCGSVEVSVSRDTAATTSAAEAPATTAGGADTAAAAEPAATAAVAQENRAEILLLEGALLDGQQFDLAATAGNDVLLWFWAPW